MGLELALLDASYADDPAARNFRREFDADLVRYGVRDGDLPPSPADEEWAHDGVVVTGSAASVYWNRDWIAPLERWVVAAADAGVPLLGVCFGHQLLADAAGGRVTSMGEYELGYHMVHHDGGCRLFEGLEEWFVAFTAHSDEVVGLPPGATPHATNPYSLHAFERGRTFGVQFHPEVDVEAARRIMVHRGVDGEHVERMLEAVADGAHNEADAVDVVFDNFETVAREARAES